MRRKVNEVVQAFLEDRVAAGYFSEPRLALTVYLELRRELSVGSFSIADLDKSLAVLTRAGGPLVRSKLDTQLRYHEPLAKKKPKSDI
ncbi:hypothetical protein [Parapedobacter sp. DT-150]|uniref:hypothetical protein n=1 Tax=Parapedobacter sp. DT-150 TaxID=3396162 RepID=UPI003F1953B7